MRMRTLLVSIAFAALTTSAHAAPAPRCTPNLSAGSIYSDKALQERAQRLEVGRCEAVNSATAEWEGTVTGLRRVYDDADRASRAGRWDEFRTIARNTAPELARLLRVADEHPKTFGADGLRHNLTTGLLDTFKNAGLQQPLNLDEAFSEIDRASQDSGKRTGAATAFLSMTLNVASNASHMGGELANAAGAAVSKKGLQEQQQQTAQLRDRLAGNTAAAYVDGFSDRFNAVSAAFQVAGLSFLLACMLVFTRRAKLGLLVKLPAVTLTLSLVVWLVNLLAPFALPYLAPLVLGAALAAAGIVLVFAGTPQRPALVPLDDPKKRTAGMVALGIAAFIVAFLVPQFVSVPAACLIGGVAVLLWWEKMFTPGRWGGRSDPMGVSGLKVADDNLHGSAGWGSPKDAADKGHLGATGEAGFTLGRMPGAGTTFSHVGHVLTCAPTRAGKGIGAVIPNLLEYPGSALVVDIKGENYAVTARRRRELGHTVYVVDPFGVTGAPSSACNWLDRLDVTSPDCVGEAAALAECLVISTGGENTHFDETARGLLQGLMLHVAGLPEPERRHLGTVRELLTADEADFLGSMADMSADPGAAYGVPARAANSLMSTGDRERGSILSTARRSTAFLDDPRMVKALSRSDFDFRQFKRQPITVYLVIPPAKLEQNSRFLRGFIGSTLAALTSDQIKPKHRVAFFLDEFAQLGKMTAIENAISLVAGYGVVFWLFVQDLSQLEGVYPKWRTFLANTTKHFYGTADLQTAKYINESLGKATVEFETAGRSSRIMDLTGSSTSDSQHYTGRDLLSVDEVLRLGPTKPIVFASGEPPYMLERINYLEDNAYTGKYDANPYH